MSDMDMFAEGKNQGNVQREIVEQVLDSSQNLREKTELDKPMNWACLTSMHEFMENVKLKENANLEKSTELLKNFMGNFYSLMMSYQRKSRKEYIDIVGKLANKVDEQPPSELMKQ